MVMNSNVYNINFLYLTNFYCNQHHSLLRYLLIFFLQAEECKIEEGIQRNLLSGEEYCITVNAKNAGRGAVTCRIRSVSGR